MSVFSAQPTSSPGVKNNDDHGNNNGGTRPAAAPASAFLGSMLFTRCVSGTRVVPRGQPKSVGGVDFTGYGASVSGYPHDYLTAACAVGLSPAELDEFLLRLNKALRKAKGDRAGGAASGESPAAARLKDGVNAGTVSGQSHAAAELRGEEAAEEGDPTVAVAENGLEKAEASSLVVGAEAAAGHHAAQSTPNGRVAATTVEHHATQGTPEEVVVVAAAAAAEHHAEENTADVVVATAAGHHAAQAAQDTTGVEQSRVVPGTTDSDRFGGVSDSGVDGRAMPKVSEALGLEDDDDWDAVD